MDRQVLFKHWHDENVFSTQDEDVLYGETVILGPASLQHKNVERRDHQHIDRSTGALDGKILSARTASLSSKHVAGQKRVLFTRRGYPCRQTKFSVPDRHPHQKL